MKTYAIRVATVLIWTAAMAPVLDAAESAFPAAPAAPPSVGPYPRVTPPPPAAVQEAGDGRVTLDFRALPIEEVFDLLSRRDKVNIILSKGVTGPVSVKLYNVTVSQAIHAVANAAGYWVEMRNGDYIIVGKETNLDITGAQTQVKTFTVQYSDVKQVADLLARYASRYGKITPLIGRKLVVVEDLPGYVQRMENLLEQLDIQPKQVMIEARILEVTLDESERFGIDWKKIFGSSGNVSGSFGTSGLAAGTPAVPSQGFFFSLVNNNLTAYFDALATSGRVRTLSTPKLLALENQESKVIIGDSTGYKVTTTINLVTTESIQFLESGVILRVIASVDQRGRVQLKVQPEVSTASLLDGIPSKRSTQVTTELICEDGQSIFIGGLMRARSSTERDGVPILRDVPVIGNLFSSSFEATATAETVVIITPYIIRQPLDAAKASEEKTRLIEHASGLIMDLQLKLERGRPQP
ncbi:MAG: type II secretion system protein GspD [Betaproteobacteria bacterium]|nr:type II secretion system protein GspD [Betaproteobacteria bacterium]